jgi:D-alanine-D-alanine ligase
MKNKVKIGVLMGGASLEREISLLTGRGVCQNLDKKKYEVLPIQISEQGKFLLDQKFYLQLNNKKNKSNSSKKGLILIGESGVSKAGLDMVFIALHGTYGEDGAIQGMLEIMGVPYTGSGILSSALAMDKVRSAEIYNNRGMLTPDFVSFGAKEWIKNKPEVLRDIKKLGLPVVIKPVNQGSAVGVSILKKQNELTSTINKTIKQFPRLMAQQFITGDEATCGILEKDGVAFALPTTRIISNANEFYDYASKYDEGGSTHICPADFSKKINKQLQELAIKAHHALDCRGMSRTDFFVTPKGKIYTIETNTIPGMVPTSLLPEAAEKAGITFSEMLDLIIKASL